MRIATAALILFASPAAAQLSPSQCKQLSAGMGNTVAVLDKMRGSLAKQPFADLTKNTKPELQASGARAQLARDKFALAISTYAASLEDFQAQLDICARR